MPKNYNEVIDSITGEKTYWYEENGFRISFVADESNSDYQAYLRWLENPDAEENGTIS